MVLKSEEDRKERAGARRPFEPQQAFAAFGWIGLGFLIVGGLDFLLAWFPPAFESREWQFAVATRSFSSLPVPTIGLGMLLVGAAQRANAWWAWAAAVGAAGMGAIIVLGVIVWLINVPLAIEQVPDEVATGMYRSILRTAVQSLVYPATYGYLALTGFRIGSWAVSEA